MSTTPPPTDRRDRRPAPEPTAAPAEPQPWRTAADARGWRVIGRGRRAPQPPPLVTVAVDLDRAQSDWLRQEAERTGLDYPALLKRLVDAARGAE